MTKKVGHPPAPQRERPDARVTHPQKRAVPSTPDIRRDTFTTIVSAAFPNLLAGTVMVRAAAQKIQKAAEPIIGEARHAYQRLRLEQLRGEAQGLPAAFGARLDQLAPDLKTYEPGLNQDALGKDLDEAAVLIGEYQALGRLPLLHGLADTVSEKYQAAFAEAVGSAEVRVQQRIIERHQLINQFYHIQEQGQKFAAPAILKQRIGELTAVGDLNDPLAEVTDQRRFVAASQGLANLTELYGMAAQVKVDNITPGVVRVADATAAWASDQLTTHFERYWDPENSETLDDMASQHGKALGSAVILDRTRFESDAMREQKFNALAGMNAADKTSWEHALLVIRHTETVVVPREAANERRKQLDPRSGFRTAWQLEYSGFGWGGVAADRTGILKTVDDVGKRLGITDLVGETLNDNVITRTYQTMATSGNPYELERARLAKEASPLFMDRFNEGPRLQEDLALATAADWAVFKAKTDHDARLMAALEGLLHKAEDRLPQPEAGWADKRAAFVIAANRLFGVEHRAGGHATDAQLLRSHYAITANMINVMREQQRYGVTKEYAEKYLAFFNDTTAPMELRRMGATVYEYYLIQNQKREEDLRVRNVAQSEFNEVRPEATLLAVETGGSGGSLHGGCNWYDASVYQAPNQIGTKGRELLAKVARLEATHSLLELRMTYAGDEKRGAPGMATLLREYGVEHRNVAEKTLYVLGGWIKQAYQGSGVADQDADVAAKIHDVNDMVFEIDRALSEVAQGDMARFQMVNHVHGYGSTFHTIGKLTEEAKAVIVYRDIVQDIEAMALASVATAGVGAAMGLTMRTGKLTNDLLRATKMLVRIVGRQATFLHVNAAGKWLLRGQQDLYDFSKGYRYNLFNLGVQIAEFELMGMAHHQVRALRQLKDVAKSASTLRTVLATTAKFSHDVVRDTLFFHGWTPFGAAIRGIAHGDMAEIQGGLEALGSAEGFHHSLVLTFGLGLPIGRAPSTMAVKYALKHGIREMTPVAARQERIAALEQQVATLAARGAGDPRTPTLIFELRQQQEQLAAHNAQVMEKLTEQYRDSEELKQQAQALKAQVDHSRFNTATAQQAALKHRVEVAQGANAPATQQIALLKRAEQAAQVRATLATRLLHHQLLPAQVAMATQLEATHIRNQRQLAENGQQIEKLERAMARPEISNDALLAKSPRLALALQKQIALMAEVNAMSPGRFAPEAIRVLVERRAVILKTAGITPDAETQAASEILHDQQLQTLSAQAAVVKRPTAAQKFMQVFQEATASDGKLRKEIAAVLRSHAEAMLHGVEHAQGTAVEYSGAPWMDHFLTHATEAAREIFAAIRRNWSEVQNQDESALAETISNEPHKAASAIVADIANILSWAELLQFAAEDPTDTDLQVAITRGAQQLQTTLESLRQLPREIRTPTQVNEADPVAAFLKAFCEKPARAKILRTALAHIDTLTRASGKPTHYSEQLDRALGIKAVAKPMLDPQIQREAQLARQQITERYKTYPDDHVITTFVRNLPIARANPEYRIHVLKGMEDINALALPDGTVFVSDRLVASCTYQEELEFVLQHEFTHIRDGHAAQKFSKDSVLSKVGRERFNEYVADMEEMVHDRPNAANPYGGIIFLRRIAEEENGRFDLVHGNTYTRLINLEYAIALIDMDALKFELNELPGALKASFEHEPDTWGIFEKPITTKDEIAAATAAAQEASLTAALSHYGHITSTSRDIDRTAKADLLSVLAGRIDAEVNHAFPGASDTAVRCMRMFLLRRGIRILIQTEATRVEFMTMLDHLPAHFPATRAMASHLFREVMDAFPKGDPATNYTQVKNALDVLKRAYPHVTEWKREEEMLAKLLLKTFDPATSRVEDYLAKLASDGLEGARNEVLGMAIEHFKLSEAGELKLRGVDPSQYSSRAMANAQQVIHMAWWTNGEAPSRSRAAEIADQVLDTLNPSNFEDLLSVLDAYGDAITIEAGRDHAIHADPFRILLGQHPDILYPRLLKKIGKGRLSNAESIVLLERLQRIVPNYEKTTLRGLGVRDRCFSTDELAQIHRIIGNDAFHMPLLATIRHMDDRNAVFALMATLVKDHGLKPKMIEEEDDESGSYSQLIRHVLRTYRFNLEDSLERDQLLTATAFMTDPSAQLRLQKTLLARHLPTLDRSAQKTLLFHDRRVLDYAVTELREQFVDRQMDSPTELREIKDLVVGRATGIASEAVGAHVLKEGLGKILLKDKERLLKALLLTRQSNAALRQYVAEIVLAASVQERDPGGRLDGFWKTVEEAADFKDQMKNGMSPATFEAILYRLDVDTRRVVANEILVGENGILLDRDRRVRVLSWFFEEFVKAPQTPAEKTVYTFLKRAFTAVAEKADVSTLYFILHPIIVERMLGTPKQSMPWQDAMADAKAGILRQTKPQGEEEYYLSEIIDDSIHVAERVIVGDTAAQRKKPSNSQFELVLPYLDAEVDTIMQLSPVEFVKSLASQLGAPGVRFLQSLGLFTELPTELQREFDEVYDNMHGQFKLSALNTLEKNWDAAKEGVPLENLGSRVGGGSLVSVYRMTIDGQPHVVRVSNPNAAYRSEVTAYNLTQILEADPDLARGLPLLGNIREWIRADLAIQDPDAARAFVEQNDHFQVDGNPYTIRIPGARRQEAKFTVEGYVDGHNLTQWDTLAAQHNMRQIVSIIAKNAAQQLMSGVVHPDMHIGNIRITDNREIFWLDSNYVLKLDARDKAFIEDVMMSAGDMPAIAKRLVTYLTTFPENSALHPEVLQQKLLERLSSGTTSDVGETVSGIVAAISEAKGVIPLHMMLLLKNALSLDRLAKKAGFATLAEAVTVEDTTASVKPADTLPGLPPELPPIKVETYSGAPWMRDAGQRVLEGARKVWEWLREDPDIAYTHSQKPPPDDIPADPVDAIFSTPNLTPSQQAEQLRTVFYNTHATDGDMLATNGVLTFFEFVKSEKLTDAEIRAGARDVANALMKRPDLEHGPFIPNTFGSYMHNFLGLSPRDFSRSGSEQLKVWTQEAYDGFLRRAQKTQINPPGLPSPETLIALYGVGTTGFDAEYIHDTVHTVYELAAEHHIPLTTEDVLRLIEEMHCLAGTADKTKNAVDIPMALWSWVNRRRLLESLGLPGNKSTSGQEVEPTRYAQVKLPNTPFSIAIQDGWFESEVGFDVALYVGDVRHSNLLATIGFQHSHQGIEIVKYQGGLRGRHDNTGKTLLQFRNFSGGIDPLPWAAQLVGKLLLGRTQQEGGQLRWIAGQQVAEAEHYNQGDEVRRIQQLYDTTAQNLGFRHKGTRNPWYRYTKDPAEFGSALRNARDIDRAKLDTSVATAEATMRANHVFEKLMMAPKPIQPVTSAVEAAGEPGPQLDLPGLPPLLAPGTHRDGHVETYSGVPWMGKVLAQLPATFMTHFPKLLDRLRPHRGQVLKAELLAAIAKNPAEARDQVVNELAAIVSACDLNSDASLDRAVRELTPRLTLLATLSKDHPLRPTQYDTAPTVADAVLWKLYDGNRVSLLTLEAILAEIDEGLHLPYYDRLMQHATAMRNAAQAPARSPSTGPSLGLGLSLFGPKAPAARSPEKLPPLPPLPSVGGLVPTDVQRSILRSSAYDVLHASATTPHLGIDTQIKRMSAGTLAFAVQDVRTRFSSTDLNAAMMAFTTFDRMVRSGRLQEKDIHEAANDLAYAMTWPKDVTLKWDERICRALALSARDPQKRAHQQFETWKEEIIRAYANFMAVQR